MKQVSVIDSHTGGEPTRVVIAGGPDLGGQGAVRKGVFPTPDPDRIGTVDPLLVGRAHVVHERGEHVGSGGA